MLQSGPLLAQKIDRDGFEHAPAPHWPCVSSTGRCKAAPCMAHSWYRCEPGVCAAEEGRRFRCADGAFAER